MATIETEIQISFLPLMNGHNPVTKCHTLITSQLRWKKTLYHNNHSHNFHRK